MIHAARDRAARGALIGICALGVHVIGLRSTELVAEATLALRLESTVEEPIRTIHARPTMAEAVGEAAHAAHGAAIHS